MKMMNLKAAKLVCDRLAELSWQVDIGQMQFDMRHSGNIVFDVGMRRFRVNGAKMIMRPCRWQLEICGGGWTDLSWQEFKRCVQVAAEID